jgi:ribosomal subunit interface protein
MQVHVIGRHMSLNRDQIAHAETEAAKLAKFFDGINDISVTFNREHDDLKAEIVCTVTHGGTLVAIEKGRTVPEAVDLASENMARQIKKYKEKLRDRRLHGFEESAPPAASEAEGGETEEDSKPASETGET